MEDMETKESCNIVKCRVSTNIKEKYAFRPYEVVNIIPVHSEVTVTSAYTGPFDSDLSENNRCRIPKPRSGHRMVFSNKYDIYSFGGYAFKSVHDEEEDVISLPNCLLYKELWKFNIASKEWKKLKTSGEMPVELVSFAACLLGDQLVVFGGTSVPFGETSSNSIHTINLNTLHWKSLPATGSLPTQQYGQALAYDSGRIFVVGGTTGFDYSIDVHSFDFRTRQWSFLPTQSAQPFPRYRHEIVMEDDKIYVFGGGTAFATFSLKNIPVFDLKEKTWETLSVNGRCPDKRYCHSCVRFNDDVIICGGYNGSEAFSDVWKFNLKTFRWTMLPCQLPVPVYFHSATISPEGEMFVFGGVIDIENNERTNKIFSVWITIPPLSEMCWQAVQHYKPYMAYLNRMRLVEEGVPLKFIDRVDFKYSY